MGYQFRAYDELGFSDAILEIKRLFDDVCGLSGRAPERQPHSRPEAACANRLIEMAKTYRRDGGLRAPGLVAGYCERAWQIQPEIEPIGGLVEAIEVLVGNEMSI